jgi:hypothetical protein
MGQPLPEQDTPPSENIRRADDDTAQDDAPVATTEDTASWVLLKFGLGFMGGVLLHAALTILHVLTPLGMGWIAMSHWPRRFFTMFHLGGLIFVLLEVLLAVVLLTWVARRRPHLHSMLRGVAAGLGIGILFYGFCYSSGITEMSGTVYERPMPPEWGPR